MTIIYRCKRCNEQIEMPIEEDLKFKVTGQIEHEPDWTIQDFDCLNCGYENTIKIFCEVE